MAKGTARMAVKGSVRVQKWHTSDPATQPPDEVVDAEQWIEDGAVVTDPERIAALEAQAEKGDKS